MTNYLSGIDSLMLYVGDVKNSVAFYEKLGFKRRTLKQDFAAVSVGGLELHLHDKHAVPGRYFEKESLAEPKGAGLYIYVAVTNVDAYYRHLLDAGIVTSTE